MKSIAELVIGKIVPAAQSMFDMANGISALSDKFKKPQLKMGEDGEFDKKIRMNEIKAKIAECQANLQADPPPDAIQRVQSLDSNQCLSGMYYLNTMWKEPQEVFSTEEAKKYRNTEIYTVNPNELQFFVVKENLFFADDIQGPFSGTDLPDNSINLPGKPPKQPQKPAIMTLPAKPIKPNPPNLDDYPESDRGLAEADYNEELKKYQKQLDEYNKIAQDIENYNDWMEDYEELSTEYTQTVQKVKDYYNANDIQYPLQMYDASGEKWGDKIYVSFQSALDSLMKYLEKELEKSKVQVISSRKTIKIDEGSDMTLEEEADREEQEITKAVNQEEWKIFDPKIDKDFSQFLVDTQKIYDDCAINGRCQILDKGNRNSLITEKLIDWIAWQKWVKSKIKNKFENTALGMTPSPNLDSFKNIILTAEYRSNKS